MARAYICLARNDLADNLLQVLDLHPNSSQRIPSLTPQGQTGYITWEPQHDTVTYTVVAVNKDTAASTFYGLGAYLADNVKDIDNANIVLTPARIATIQDAILARVAAGLSLSITDVNAIIGAATGGGAASTLNAGGSTGSLEEVLSILAGEVYRVPAGAFISLDNHAWNSANMGVFAGPGTDYRDIRKIADTGSLHASALTGTMAQLKAPFYTWVNPAFTYSATGTAKDIAGVNLTSGTHRAVTIYDNAGGVI